MLQSAFLMRLVGMLKNAILKTACGMSLAALMTVSALAQNGVAASAQPVNGIFAMPIPQSPFTVTVVGKSVRPLRDGTTEVLQTFNQIARDSSGRVYRGVRQMAPTSLPGTSQLLYIHIYDPATRLSTI